VCDRRHPRHKTEVVCVSVRNLNGALASFITAASVRSLSSFHPTEVIENSRIFASLFGPLWLHDPRNISYHCVSDCDERFLFFSCFVFLQFFFKHRITNIFQSVYRWTKPQRALSSRHGFCIRFALTLTLSFRPLSVVDLSGQIWGVRLYLSAPSP
jgi:hypothetical protein